MKKYFKNGFKLLFVFSLISIFICCSESSSSNGGGGGSSSGGSGDSSGGGGGGSNNDITGLKSYVLQSTAHNRLEWDLINNSTYNIYRYQLQSDALPDLIIQNHNTNEYEDNTSISDTPYYYKVSSIINGVEGNLSNFIFGLMSSNVDGFENNNNLNDFQDDDAGLPLNMEYDAIIYSCKKDNAGGIVTDIDWYKYRDIAEYFEVIVTLDNTAFTDDDIKLQFRYESSDSNIILKDFSINDNSSTTCGFGDPGDYDNDAGNDPVNVYFRIYIDENNVDKTNNIIEGYKLEISKF